MIYEVRMPAAAGAMMARVEAPSRERAEEGARYWFEVDPEGPRDTIDGEVTVEEVTHMRDERPPMWVVEDDYPPKPEAACE